MRSEGWTPVLSPDGKTYCSPRCGFQCTKAEHDAAEKAAAELAARLGEGWTPQVWENLGWYWKATKGCATVYPSDYGAPEATRYSAWVEFNGGDFTIQSIKNGPAPEDALGYAVQEVRTLIAHMNAALADLIGGAHD